MKSVVGTKDINTLLVQIEGLSHDKQEPLSFSFHSFQLMVINLWNNYNVFRYKRGLTLRQIVIKNI